MPAVNNLTINDGQTTPVAHTFQPAKATADYTMYEDRISGVYVGFSKLHLTMVRPKGDSKVANRNLRVVASLEVPVLETLGNSDAGITPPPTVAFKTAVKMEFTLPERATFSQRKDIRTYAMNMLANAVLSDAIDSLSMPY